MTKLISRNTFVCNGDFLFTILEDTRKVNLRDMSCCYNPPCCRSFVEPKGTMKLLCLFISFIYLTSFLFLVRRNQQDYLFDTYSRAPS